MFQMDCSNCGKLIKSPQLVEVQVTKCPHCEEIVGVMNVAVSSRKYNIDLRSSLKKMLLSARGNFRLNKAEIVDQKSNYDIDKRLAKLLRRDDFRLDLTYDLYVQINFNSHKRLVKLLNISPSGAAVLFTERSRSSGAVFEKNLQLPEQDYEIDLILPLPGDIESLSLSGRVVWSHIPAKGTLFPSIPMGVQFKDIEEGVREKLWDFIINSETPSSALLEE